MGWKIIVLLFSLSLSQVIFFQQESIGKPEKRGKEKASFKRIESDVTDAFENIIFLWKNEKYDALYDCGSLKSCTHVSKEDFEKRMAKQSWELATSWETVRKIQVSVKNSTLAYVAATIGYKPKTGGEPRFQTKTYEMRFENNAWRINLEKLLRFPK
jgi:hypothetical protein